MKACTQCGEATELRPYGPHGAMICYDCAMKNPEETEKAFLAQVEACVGSEIVVIGSEVGPYPCAPERSH